MEKMTQDGYVGGGIYRPEKRPFFQEAAMFLYNKNSGTIMGRTPLSWAKIIIFYIIFYICLACFFSLLMMVVYYTLDPRIPKYKLDSSLIGTSPGLGYRPMPSDDNSLSTLIYYKGTEQKDYKYWKNSLEAFLKDYKRPGETPGRGANIYSCGYDNPPTKGKICEVDFKSWDPCNYENDFGFNLQSPCVFLKLNKIFGWVPEFYEVNELPKEMPDDLKNYIKETYYGTSNTSASTTQRAPNPNEIKTIWVHCEGETPADKENLGPIEYKPRRGFPFYYFPFENDEGYLSPLVAIQILNPRKGILINIECRAWAKNIVHDRKERLGSVHFELMID